MVLIMFISLMTDILVCTFVTVVSILVLVLPPPPPTSRAHVSSSGGGLIGNVRPYDFNGVSNVH
jgi:hypothetical protein